ncbi:MAG: DUF1631 domain-containing protein [Cellvibrionaceae bacterium]|nr:DUF1631 domain-containing protein [Cellvibrionaceae bacterium]
MQAGPDKATIIPLHRPKASQGSIYEPSMKEKLAQLPTPVLRLREISFTQLKAAVQQLFDHVDDALFELADRATSNLEQNVFFESMRDIRIQRRSMEKAFLAYVDTHYVALLQAGEVAHSANTVAEPSDDLSLVSKEALEELVAIDSLVSKSWSHNKSALHDFALRLNTLVAADVSEKINPVSPRTLADAFGEAAKRVTIDIKAKLVLFKLFERHVMSQLGAVLSAMNQALSELGIALPAPAAPSSPRTASPVAGEATASPPAPAANHVAATGLYATLQSLMNQQRQSASVADAGAIAGGDVSQLLQLLSCIQQQQLQHYPLVTEVSQPSERVCAQSIAAAVATMAEGDLIDERSRDVMRLVDMLFSFILQDRSLPDPVKLLLSRLQIPFIKVALVDEQFFKKDAHPARRLLNEMAMASIGWTGDLSHGRKDPLIGKIDYVVEKVLTEFDHNAEIFTVLLTDFMAFLEKERRRMMLFEKRALDAEDGKAKAELGRQQVDQKIADRVADQVLPDSFLHFITGPWSNILFLIFMRQGPNSQQWRDALLVAERLIWSAQLIESDKHKAQLRALLPNLLSSIKKGLDDVSFNPVKQAKIFDKFKAHHLSLFEIYRKEGFVQQSAAPETQTHTPSKQPEPVNKQPEPVNKQPEPVNKQPEPVNKQSELTSRGDKAVPTAKQGEREAGGVEAGPVAAAEAPESVQSAPGDTSPAASEMVESAPVDQQYSNLVDNFVVGLWFEKTESGSSSFRCRLAAIIRTTGKYIFVNRAGVKVAEETRETLAVLLEQGQLRTLDDSMLFDRALESVIATLRA